MSPWSSMKQVAFEDRKRLRESIKEAELSASPKKGKLQDGTDAFSFPAFAAPLAEIAQECQANGIIEHAEVTRSGHHEVLPQPTPPCLQLWQGPRCAAHVQNTPEPHRILSFDKPRTAKDESVTPALVLDETAGTRPVQTLNARAIPLSPFEWGDIPDHLSIDDNIATPASAIVPTLPDAQDDASIESRSSEGAAPMAEHADDGVPPLHGAGEQNNQFLNMNDLSLQSQNASQSSSLADTKILRLSSRLLSKNVLDASHCSFKFSKAFTFHGLLGDTKTSTVYFAQAADGLFAIKEMKKPFVSKADRADMMHELRAVNSLPKHANVVNYVRFWQEGRKLHIQMELCQGGSLDTLLKRSEICQDEKLPEDLLWLILRAEGSCRRYLDMGQALNNKARSGIMLVGLVCSDAAHGLQHIHAHGVLHMDIKPENMFLDSSGIFKLGDFGIAISLTNQSGWEEGDGRYVAPELLHGRRPTTGAADIYSLGATMLHCSIGTSLPMERSPQTVRRHLAGHGYSVEFQHMIASMVTELAEDRPTADMLSNVLQRKRSKHAFEVIRHTLAQVAGAVHAQRMANQRTLHCSPSFSLSQSVDNATPGSVGRPAGSKPERVRSQQFSGKSRNGACPNTGTGCSPGSAAPLDRAPLPPAPAGRTAALVDRGPPVLAGRGQNPPSRVGTPPSVLPKLQPHQKRYHRSPSAGSFDRCGALSYSSNGQASGSLNLELYPDNSVPAPGAANTASRSKMCMRPDDPTTQVQRSSMLRPASLHRRTHAARSDAHGLPKARHSRKPLTLIVPDGLDPVEPSPRSDVLHRYFSSQVQHEDYSLKSQTPLTSVSTAALSQVEVTGPFEANVLCTTSAVRKPRQRHTVPLRPPDLHELKDCLASARPAERHTATLRAASKTKGRAMVWKGLQDITPSSASALQGIVTALREPAEAADKLSRPAPLKFGQGPARRSRGAKVAGVASNMVSRDQENDGVAANIGLHQGRVSGPARLSHTLPLGARPMQPHQSKLRVVKTLNVSKAREMSTSILASSRPELKQPLVCHARNLGV